MALIPLATVLDLAQRGVTIEAGEAGLAGIYLAVASAAVRDAAGVPISRVTSTVQLMGKPGLWLPLPGPPVTAVTAVAMDGDAITDFRLISDELWRAHGWLSIYCQPSEVTVTQTHGLLDVPADVVDLVCRMAAAALVAFRSRPDGEGLAVPDNKRQESLGDYAVTYGANGQISEMDLPERIRRQLAARFGGAGGVAVVGSR